MMDETVDVEKLRQQVMVQVERLATSRDSIVRLRKRLLQRQVEVTELQQQLEELQARVRHYEAYCRGVEDLMRGLGYTLQLVPEGERGGNGSR